MSNKKIIEVLEQEIENYQNKSEVIFEHYYSSVEASELYEGYDYIIGILIKEKNRLIDIIEKEKGL